MSKMSSYCTKYICQQHITRLPSPRRKTNIYFSFCSFLILLNHGELQKYNFCRNPIKIITMKMMQWRFSWINHFLLQESSCSHCIKWGISSILVLSSSLSLPTTQMTQMKRSMKLTRVLIEGFLLFVSSIKALQSLQEWG